MTITAKVRSFLFLSVVLACVNIQLARAEEQNLTVAVSATMFKNEGNPLPASSKGKFTAQLFNGSGGGEPIWTEVTYESLTFPNDAGQAVVVILGAKSPLTNPANNNEPIQLKNKLWLLFSCEVDGKTYSTPRLALNVAAFAHEADKSYNATGPLKAIVDDYEKRIKRLEDELTQRVQQLDNLIIGYKKLRLYTDGTPITEPLEH